MKLLMHVLKKWRDSGYENVFGRSLFYDWYYQLKPPDGHIIKILDIGCSKGVDLISAKNVLISSNPVELWGIDFRERLLKIAEGSGIYTKNIDLEMNSLPFDSNIFDFTISNQVFEHLKNWLWVFHEQVRVTKVGGGLLSGSLT